MNSWKSLEHRYTAPLLDGSLGADIRTMAEKVNALIDESDIVSQCSFNSASNLDESDSFPGGN